MKRILLLAIMLLLFSGCCYPEGTTEFIHAQRVIAVEMADRLDTDPAEPAGVTEEQKDRYIRANAEAWKTLDEGVSE